MSNRTSLRMRVLPRFPARIVGTDGIKVEQESDGAPDLIVRSAYDQLSDITSVPDPSVNYFMMWDAVNNYYRRIPFQGMFDSAGVAQGYPTINAAEDANIPIVVHAIEVYGSVTVGDGLGGLYIDTDNGASETFISGDGRTWYLAADIREERLTAVLAAKINGAMQKAQNLNDVADKGTAQDNIQIGAVFADVATAQGATIAARNKRIRTQFYATASRVGGANYRRISFADLTGYPSLAYFRSTDRFMPDGSTPDATNGGYWTLDEQELDMSMFSTVGGVDETAKIQAAFDTVKITGKSLVVSQSLQNATDLTVSGDLTLRGRNGGAIVSTGAAAIILSGTITRLTFDNVHFDAYTRAALWLLEGAQIGSLFVRDCRFNNCRISLSNEGYRLSGYYGIDKYHGPQQLSSISRLIFTQNKTTGGKAGVALTCIVEDANVDANEISGLTNVSAAGSNLENAVVGVQIYMGGLAAEGSGKYSNYFDLMRRLSVTNNSIHDCTQTIASKGSNAIITTGFGVVITGNKIDSFYNTNATDPSDPDLTTDDEAIYAKAAECIVANNTIRNSGGDQGAINIKGIDVTEEMSSLLDPPGRNRIVTGNDVQYDATHPMTHIRCGVEVEATPCVISNNIFRGLTKRGITIRGSVVVGKTFEEVIITGNRFEGTHDDAILVTGGMQGLVVQNNVNVVTGGNGNCAFVDLSQSRGALWKNFNIQGNTHRVSGRVITTFNAFIRMAVTAYDIDTVLVSGNIVDHFIAGQVMHGAYIQGSGGFRLMDYVQRDNTWPENIGANILYSDNFSAEYLIDEEVKYTTVNATPVLLFSTRMFTTSVAMVDLDLVARDVTAGDAAAYSKKSGFQRSAGNVLRIGTEATILAVESDATWDAVTTLSGNLLQIAITGDATNNVQWKGRIKANVKTTA